MSRVPYEKRSHYPHLKPQEIAIWERFIERNPDAYDEVEYDLALGLKPPFSTLVSPETGGNDERLYLRKIDVVGYKGDSVEVIEIKPNAGPGAIGQVLAYATLYKHFVNAAAKLSARVITDLARADMYILAAQMNVALTLV